MPDVTPRDAFRRGARELLPLAPGVFAWGLVTGVAMVKSGLTVAQALGLSLLAYAGSAQLAALPLIATAAPLWVVTATALVVNLRFVVYSAMTRGYFAHLPPARRAALGYLVGDVMLARFMTLVQQEPGYPHRVAYYAGGAIANWVVWQVSSIAGILAADAIPAAWGLELAGTLALIALVVPLCARAPALGGVVVAGVVALVAHDLPLRLGLALAIFCGMGAALALEAVIDRRDSDGRSRA